MSHTTTVNLSDTEEKAMSTITADIDAWVQNAALNRARIAKEEIIAELIIHCNDNAISLAVGEDAQVTQAFDLGVAEVITDAPAP
tara:strand:- start:1311 stop:1565 length:255 start_codon:yes stop_codon:yes gene_type:complete